MKRISKLLNAVENNNLIVATVLISLVAGFVASNIGELSIPETFPDYYDNIKPFLSKCDSSELPEMRGTLKWWMLCVSYNSFGSERIIPYLFSIALLPTTFFFVRQLVKSNVAGLVAVGILLTSGTFTNFDTTATYEQSWVVFLLWSFILLLRGHTYAPVLIFIIAFFAKPLSLIYLPTFLLANHYSNHKNKSLILGMFVVLACIIVVKLIINAQPQTESFVNFGGQFEFNQDELIAGLYNWWFYLNASILVAISLPLVVFKLAHMIKHNKQKTSALIILCGIVSVIVSVPLIDGFTNQLNHAYRFTPLVVLSGGAIGLIVKTFFHLGNHAQSISHFFMLNESKEISD